jgi:excisionase family DNA binding protein
MSLPKQLSVAQVSSKLQCAGSTVRKLIADGSLRASRITNRTIRISEIDLKAYLDSRANVVSRTGTATTRSDEDA